jgi:hypothetical protein
MHLLEQQYNRLLEDKRRSEQNANLRVDANIKLIQQLRAELQEQVHLYEERKKQNREI